MVDWETIWRYGFGHRVLMREEAGIKAWMRRELAAKMRWLVEDVRYEALEIMRAEDEGMIPPAPSGFDEGYAAYRSGLGFLDNPHVQDSVAFRRWVDGYVRSMQDRRSA